MVKGQVVSGVHGKIIVRQKSDSKFEIGELLITENKDSKILLQVFDLIYGSQISSQNLELISGLMLEEGHKDELYDAHLRNYILASMKNLISISKDNARISKSLPTIFSEVREINKDDLSFLTKPKNPLYIGNLRSGSKNLDVPIYLQGDKVFSHHILIPGTTGRGKSVLVSNILWSATMHDYCGVLVLDPHDEYYGRNKIGLKDHPNNTEVVYYTPKDPPAGCKSLKINIANIKPSHFNGVIDFSDPQRQAINIYYKNFGLHWIEAILQERKIDSAFRDDTLAVVKRQIMYILGLELSKNKFHCSGVFDIVSGESTITDITSEIEDGKTVIIDTSSFSGQVEILIGSLIATEIFRKYKKYKISGKLKDKPVVSIILEEAPRVLGKEVLEKGSNIFSTIAREGRKFKVGLTAITQLPSLIPRQILANMNTKIILGVEMKPERTAIIESASQDLSEDDRNIASLDIGEALITSNFSRFATPIKIPFFDDIVKKSTKKTLKSDFSGIDIS